jgi:glutamate racemase
MLSRLLYRHVGKIDSVVLGCTHYPFIRKQIKNILGNVPFYDGGAGTARELKRRLAEKGWLAEEKGPGEIVFMSSKDIYNIAERVKELI